MRKKREKKCGIEWGRGRGKKGRKDKRKGEEREKKEDNGNVRKKMECNKRNEKVV